MTKTIWKFKLRTTEFQTIKVPRGAEFLHVDMQKDPSEWGSGLFLWALVDPKSTDEERNIEVFGTGNPIHEDMGVCRKYISTVMDSPFVWHVFERFT